MLFNTAIHSIPVEILTDIFTLAATSNRAPRNSTGWVRACKDPRDIIRLSHVCSHWRSAVLSAPSLWTSLRIVWSEVFTEWSPGHHVLKQLATQEALSQSRDLPIDLDVRADYIETPEEALAVIQSFITHAPRLRNLRLFMTLPEDMSVRALFSSFNAEFPLLESIHLRIWTEEHDRVTYPSLFSNAPCLKSVMLEHGFTRVSFAEDAFQWDRIEDIKIQGLINALDYHHILRRCIKLRSADLTVHIRGSFSVSEHPSVNSYTHSTLSSLCLKVANCNANPFIGSILFGSLTLPCLNSFTSRKLCDPDIYTPLSSFTDLIRRSRCSLEHLSVDFDDMSCPEEIHNLADSTQALRNLDVTFNCPSIKETIPSLRVSRYPDVNGLPVLLVQEPDTIWPELESLKLSGAMDPDVVLTLLDCRIPRLKVHLEMGFDLNVEKKLEELNNVDGCTMSFETREEVEQMFSVW